MREIKFKFYCSDCKTWHHADLNGLCDLGALDFRACHADGHNASGFKEYTGLHDKNGMEIYEGDIVRFSCFDFEKREPINLRIFWDNDAHAWGASASLNRDHHKIMGSRNSVFCLFMEVIGDIYTTPELIGADPGASHADTGSGG